MNEMPSYSQVRDMAIGSEAQVTLRGNQFPLEEQVYCSPRWQAVAPSEYIVPPEKQ